METVTDATVGPSVETVAGVLVGAASDAIAESMVETVTVVSVAAYTFEDSFNGTKFPPGETVTAEKTRWVQGQLDAGVLKLA